MLLNVTASGEACSSCAGEAIRGHQGQTKQADASAAPGR